MCGVQNLPDDGVGILATLPLIQNDEAEGRASRSALLSTV